MLDQRLRVRSEQSTYPAANKNSGTFQSRRPSFCIALGYQVIAKQPARKCDALQDQGSCRFRIISVRGKRCFKGGSPSFRGGELFPPLRRIRFLIRRIIRNSKSRYSPTIVAFRSSSRMRKSRGGGFSIVPCRSGSSEYFVAVSSNSIITSLSLRFFHKRRF